MTALQTTPNWKGFSKLEYLVIFGDSYSDVGYTPDESPPGDIEPLGISFPGITFANDANWVGYLATTFKQSLLIVFDYARGGDTTTDLRFHLVEEFLPYIGDSPEHAPWTESNSLFITWIGINDVGSPDYLLDTEVPMGRIFDLQEGLYQTGARNFLLIDVPPIHRCPAVSSNQEDFWKERYEGWNVALHHTLSAFVSEHPDATVFLFSSWDTFSRILDNPSDYGFDKTDTKRHGGAIWLDHLHPTSDVHKIIAQDVAAFLQSQQPVRS